MNWSFTVAHNKQTCVWVTCRFIWKNNNRSVKLLVYHNSHGQGTLLVYYMIHKINKYQISLVCHKTHIMFLWPHFTHCSVWKLWQILCAEKDVSLWLVLQCCQRFVRKWGKQWKMSHDSQCSGTDSNQAYSQ